MASDNRFDDLEVFNKKGKGNYHSRKIDRPPFISISKRFVFNFSINFTKIAAEQIGNTKKVIFLFSPTTKILGFKFVPDARGARNIIQMKKAGNFRMCAAVLFHYYSLDAEALEGRYFPKLEDIPTHGKVWTINLNEKIVIE